MRVTLDALKEHRIQQEAARKEMGDRWQEKGLIFCDRYGGFFSPDEVLRNFSKLLRKVDLPHLISFK